MLLDDFLEAAMGEPWAWGAMDCCAFAGGWIAARTARDAFEPYRGLYGTAEDAKRLVVRRGGLLAMVSAEMERCGFMPTDNPDDGDIGVITAPATQQTVAGAAVVIRRGPWWIARTQDGIACVKVPALAAWALR